MTKTRAVNATRKASVPEEKEVKDAISNRIRKYIIVLKGHEKATQTSVKYTVVGLSCISPDALTLRRVEHMPWLMSMLRGTKRELMVDR